MAIPVFDDPMTSPIPIPTHQQQQTRPSLRRATYVHVSDLTSAYNIDHAKLDQELSRVKAEREALEEPPNVAEVDDSEEDPAAATGELDPALGGGPQKRLQPPRGGYNLCVLVGKVTIVVDKRRVDGSRVRLAEVEIGDETGTVSLRARDDQIDALEEVSKRNGALVLRNCTLELYQGKHVRLAVTKWGKLSVYPDNVASTPPPPSKMNYDRNFSLIDLSVVASEMVDLQPEASYSQRPTKPESSDTASRSSSSKTTTQGHAKHQPPQPPQRRTQRDRRQSRGKAGGGTNHPSQYSTAHDVGGMQAASQMRYHGVPQFPGYVRQFPYSHASPQDQILPQASAHMMMQRQYQMQQMYHSQQERLRSGHQGQGMMLPVVAQGSFDASEYSVPPYSSSSSDQHQPGMPPVIGSSPILIPMTMQGGRGPAGSARQPTEQSQSLSLSGVQQDGEARYMSVSPDDSSQFLPGTMNPEATAFAPSYMSAQANTPAGGQVYFPFDPSQQASGTAYQPTAHHPMYAQGMMYVPPSQPASKSQTGGTEDRETAEVDRPPSRQSPHSEEQKPPPAP